MFSEGIILWASLSFQHWLILMYFLTTSLLDGGGRCWSSVKNEPNFAFPTYDSRRAGYSLESMKLFAAQLFNINFISISEKRMCRFIIQKKNAEY